MRINPIGKRKAAAEARINDHFNIAAVQSIHLDHAHALKRSQAASILAGGVPDPALVEEAQLAGVTVGNLAQSIAAKPDDVQVRELARRRAILAVRQAVTLADIAAALAGAGLQ